MTLADHVTRRRIQASAGLAAALLASAAPVQAALPAPSEPVNETMHGVVVRDPYRNLENLKSPATLAWLKAEGDDAASQLARIEGRDAMLQRITALANASGDSVRRVVRTPGDRVFFLKRKSGESQLKLVVRGADRTERVLVDPVEIAKGDGVPRAVNYFVPSWDGKRLAYGLSAGGSEDASLFVMDVDSGKLVGRPIPRVHEGGVHWAPDSRRLTYNQLRELAPGAAETETYLDTTTFLVDAGKPDAPAVALFGPLVNKTLKLDRLDVSEVLFARDGRYMIARTTDTTSPEGRLYVAPVASLGQPEIAWQQISGVADKITDVELRGDKLYLRTYAGAPRGRVLALALERPLLREATVVVPEPDNGVLVSFGLGSDAVYAEVQQGFTSRVRRYAEPGGKSQGKDAAPGRAGSTFLAKDLGHAHDDVWLVTSAWTEPPRLIVADADGKARDTGILTTKAPPGAPELEVSEVMVPSHDGALVPMAILRRKGLALDGNNPTLLVGYGSYGHSFQAFFDSRSIAWFERGGVLAYANVRGSGSLGDAWYRAGFKATKANTWKDGVACTRYLVEQRYASPKTLGIWGTSAGGIFVGRAVTSAPELFAAAIFDVGTMDAVRAEESANGITNISEFGSAHNAGEFPALLEMSTYHQIQDKTAYPAILLIHGMNDPRVEVWQSAKAAARLQAASSSGKPILLRLDGQAGHGIGSTATQAYSKQADIYSFLLWQFGRLGLKN